MAPGFLKIRKTIKSKKETERKINDFVRDATIALNENKKLFDEVKKHYNEDNITKRDLWMKEVNNSLNDNSEHWKQLSEKMDKCNSVTLSLLIESKRGIILNFASKAADLNNIVTREEFNRIYRIHGEYETILEENNLENGEVTVAMKIIDDAYETRTRNQAFIDEPKK